MFQKILVPEGRGGKYLPLADPLPPDKPGKLAQRWHDCEYIGPI